MKIPPFLQASAAVLLCLVNLNVHAQHTPATTSNEPQLTPAQGWTLWDDRVGGEYQLPPADLQRLRDVDARYQKDYEALGATPWTNPTYRILTERRNADIRGILSTDQYTRWERTYGSGTAKPQGKEGRKPAGSGTAPVPAPK